MPPSVCRKIGSKQILRVALPAPGIRLGSADGGTILALIMGGFAKLFSSITTSSLWSETKEVRILFVTMLADADSNGFVEAALPGLARLANLTIEETIEALKVLESPDQYSKDTDHDGRRVEKVSRGWKVLNYTKHRERRDEKTRSDYMREYMRERREKERAAADSVNSVSTNVNTVNNSKPQLAKAEAEAEAEAGYLSLHGMKGDARGKQTQTVVSDPVAFDAAWKSWPAANRRNMESAKTAWQDAIGRVLARFDGNTAKATDWILLRVKRYAKSPKGRGEFCGNLNNWLDKGCYDDANEAWEQSSSKSDDRSPTYQAMPKIGET